jgi:biopolymer transport protein ExbD
MSHKRSKVEGAVGVQLSLIITPMLDMSFQILAFFIMTYHPSALEGHIPGSLVPAEDTAKKSKENNDPMPKDQVSDPDLPDPSLAQAVTVYVKSVVKGEEPKTRAEGTPNQIFVKSSIDTDRELVADTQIEFDEALKKLEGRLKQMAKESGSANLKIAGDGGLRYQYLLQVYDAGKRAGFEKIHFVPPPLIKTKLR